MSVAAVAYGFCAPGLSLSSAQRAEPWVATLRASRDLVMDMVMAAMAIKPPDAVKIVGA